MNSIKRFGLVLFAISLAFGTPASGQGRAQEVVDDLIRDFPGARVLWTNEEDRRARSIFGVPMTRGETVRDAAESFLLTFGEALTGGEADFEEARVFQRLDGSTVLHYQQYVDGVTVDGSIVRLLVRNDDDTGPAVVYASGHFARPPELGLPDPVVPAAAALGVARLHPAGLDLAEWGDPELVATTESGILSRGDARLTWKVRGWTDLVASHLFWVDAISGIVIREADLTAHYRDPTPSVSGTVTGGATQGTEPDKVVGHRCGANLPQVVALPEFTVEITNGAQTTVLDSTTSDINGEYEFFGTSYPTDAKLQFRWEGPQWVMNDCSGVLPAASFALGSSFPTTIDYNANPSPFTGFDTAVSNIHLGLLKAREFLIDHLPTSQYPALYSEITVLTNNVCGFNCDAVYREFGPGEDPYLIFGGIGTSCDFNRGYSTIVAHEYSHYIGIKMLGIDYTGANITWHEGFADSLAMLAYDVTVYAENWKQNCDPDRSPLTATPRPEFDCCSMCNNHQRGMLLSAIWLELEKPTGSGGIGKAAARQLFVDWMLLASGGIADGPSGCETQSQSAGPATLIEVLVADDDDGALNNGTPNSAVICDIFADRLITSGSSPCGGSLHGGICATDVDRNGTLDFFDFLQLLNWFESGDPRADWDGDGEISMRDVLLFESDYREGC